MSYIARHRGEHRLIRAIAASGATTAMATGLVAVAGTGTAFAFFSGGFGTGSGSATTDVAKTITASAAALSGTLYPGQSGDLTVTIANPYSNRTLTITGVAAGTGSIQVSGASGCTAANADVSVNTTASVFSPSTVSAGATTPITITGAVKMGPNSASACQGATFTVPVAVTVKVG